MQQQHTSSAGPHTHQDRASLPRAKRACGKKVAAPPVNCKAAATPCARPLFLGGPLVHLSNAIMPQEGAFKYHQYQVVGRHLPTEQDPTPTVYRMKVWAKDAVRAKSKFWYFLRRLRRVKKANGQIIAVNEIHERHPTTVKNFGIWVRYQSRTGYHNMYKEYRDTTLNGAVESLYDEMGSRHRVRAPCIFIIKTATVPAAACKRDNTKQFHDSKIRFPLTHKVVRPSGPEHRTLYKAKRPTTAMF